MLKGLIDKDFNSLNYTVSKNMLEKKKFWIKSATLIGIGSKNLIKPMNSLESKRQRILGPEMTI